MATLLFPNYRPFYCSPNTISKTNDNKIIDPKSKLTIIPKVLLNNIFSFLNIHSLFICREISKALNNRFKNEKIQNLLFSPLKKIEELKSFSFEECLETTYIQEPSSIQELAKEFFKELMRIRSPGYFTCYFDKYRDFRLTISLNSNSDQNEDCLVFNSIYIGKVPPRSILPPSDDKSIEEFKREQELLKQKTTNKWLRLIFDASVTLIQSASKEKSWCCKYNITNQLGSSNCEVELLHDSAYDPTFMLQKIAGAYLAVSEIKRYEDARLRNNVNQDLIMFRNDNTDYKKVIIWIIVSFVATFLFNRS